MKIKPSILHSVALKPVIYGSLASFFLAKVKNINAITDYMSSISNIDFRSVTVPHIRWLSNKKVDRNSKKYDNSVFCQRLSEAYNSFVA